MTHVTVLIPLVKTETGFQYGPKIHYC